MLMLLAAVDSFCGRRPFLGSHSTCRSSSHPVAATALMQPAAYAAAPQQCSTGSPRTADEQATVAVVAVGLATGNPLRLRLRLQLPVLQLADSHFSSTQAQEQRAATASSTPRSDNSTSSGA